MPTTVSQNGGITPDPQYILFKDDIVFMLPGKCACTSIKSALLYMLGHNITDFTATHTSDHLTYLDKTEVLAYQHRVGIVRNPVDRLLSCWTNKVKGVDKGGDVGLYSPNRELQGGVSWDDFVDYVVSCDDNQADKHFRPLFRDLVVDGQYPATILRVHELANDWARFWAGKGQVFCGLPTLNRSQQFTSNYPIYPPRRRDIIKRYQADYEAFNSYF